MTRYEFNLHVENVYRIAIESDRPLHEVVDGAIDALVDGKLALENPDMIQAELWDDDGDQVGEIDGWGHRWVKEDE